MEDYNRTKTIDHFVDEIQSGRMKLSDMNHELEHENIEKREARIVKKRVDIRLQKFDRRKSLYLLGKKIYYGGILLILVGIFFGVGTYFGWINMGNPSISSLIPILGGAIIAITGKMQMERNPENV